MKDAKREIILAKKEFRKKEEEAGRAWRESLAGGKEGRRLWTLRNLQIRRAELRLDEGLLEGEVEGVGAEFAAEVSAVAKEYAEAIASVQSVEDASWRRYQEIVSEASVVRDRKIAEAKASVPFLLRPFL